MIIVISLVAIILITTFIVLQLPQFGKAPEGERLARLKASGFYKDGKVDNISITPAITEGTNYAKLFWNFFFGRNERKNPKNAFHFEKTDLKNLDPNKDLFIWLGHSGIYLQLSGKKILIDPVLCGYSSPFSFSTKAFAGADLYEASDFSDIDYLIITHDHWDHLDYHTVKELQPKVKQVITGLGVGAHLEYWGYPKEKLNEMIWGEALQLEDSFSIHCETARHFSGRGLKRNGSFWTSYVLETPDSRIYLGGDSGYDEFFKKLGDKYGDFDLAFLENGQYNDDWKYIHMLPGEQLKAMKDLNAKVLMPIHNSKFALAFHSWDEPMKQMQAHNKDSLRIITPKIGQVANWEDTSIIYEKWWEELE